MGTEQKTRAPLTPANAAAAAAAETRVLPGECASEHSANPRTGGTPARLPADRCGRAHARPPAHLQNAASVCALCLGTRSCPCASGQPTIGGWSCVGFLSLIRFFRMSGPPNQNLHHNYQQPIGADADARAAFRVRFLAAVKLVCARRRTRECVVRAYLRGDENYARARVALFFAHARRARVHTRTVRVRCAPPARARARYDQFLLGRAHALSRSCALVVACARARAGRCAHLRGRCFFRYARARARAGGHPRARASGRAHSAG